jgi:hypothetical protein
MLGAIILTADHNQETKFISVIKSKKKESNFITPIYILTSYIKNFIFKIK